MIFWIPRSACMRRASEPGNDNGGIFVTKNQAGALGIGCIDFVLIYQIEFVPIFSTVIILQGDCWLHSQPVHNPLGRS